MIIMNYLSKRYTVWNSLAGFLEYDIKRKAIVYLRYYTNKANYGRSLAHPYKRIWVNPNNVQKVHRATTDERGKIQPGDWDRKAVDISNFKKFQSINGHYRDNISWEETGIYNYLKAKIEERGIFDGCRTEEDLRQRYEVNIENLYHNIKEGGYKTQIELGNTTQKKPGKGEIRINIGRSGEIIFAGGGWHRLTIAKILEIKEIPAQVMIRHSEWQDIRENLSGVKQCENYKKYDKERNIHPDLKDIRSVSDESS